MSTFDLVKRSSPSMLVNAWKVLVGSRPFMVTPAHVCIFGVNGRWTLSHFLKDFSSLDWKISVPYISAPNPFHDLAWAELNCGKDCITLGSGLQTPTKVDVFLRQPLDHKGEWVSEYSEMGQTEAILYPSPVQAPELSEGDLTGTLVEAVDISFRGMSGALAMTHAAGNSGVPTCEGMFIKRGSLRAFKKTSHRPPLNHHISHDTYKKKKTFGGPPHSEQSYNVFQRALRSALGLDKMEQNLDNMEQKLDYLYRHGLVQDDLHEIGVVMDARRGIFLPASMMANIITSSAHVHVADVIGKNAPKLSKF